MKYTNIPKEFLSYETGEHFKACKICGLDLTHPDAHYLIEKAIRKYPGFKAFDVVFEYAVCFDCAENLRKELSAQSMKSIEKYFFENTNPSKQIHRFVNSDEEPDYSKFTETCLIKGTSKDEIQEYQLYGECKGNQFVYGNMPYMISGEAMEEIANVLSDKTLDELDGFAGKYLGPSPELESLFKGRKLVLI